MHVGAVLTAVAHSSDLESASLDDIFRFIRLCKLCRPSIECRQRDRRCPPAALPAPIHEFISCATGLDVESTSLYWATFKSAVWTESDMMATEEDIALFHEHGLPRGIGYRDVFPPTRTCINSACPNHRDDNEVATLSDPSTYRATLFTLRDGALPVYVTSLYCRGCFRRYHHNYYVEKSASTRTYYDGPPPRVIQVSMHHFIEAGVLELFSNAMLFGWLSNNNCARVYNTSLGVRHCERYNNPVAYGQGPCRSVEWPYSLELHSNEAMHGFLLYSLLLDKAEHGSCLILPHDGPSQKDRLEIPLAERNKAMEGIGQEFWAHACDLCFVVEESADGSLKNTV